jgi:uncharacterized membrane protein
LKTNSSLHDTYFIFSNVKCISVSSSTEVRSCLEWRKKLSNDKKVTVKDKLKLANFGWITKVTNRLRTIPDYLIVLSFSLIYITALSYVSLSNHYAFGSNAWDLGIYNQAFYSTLRHGKFFYFTAALPGNPGGSHFGIHFSPILFLLLPIYALHQNPATLLVLRPIIISIGAIPLYWLARDEFNDRKLTLLFVGAYFMYVPLIIPSCNFDVEAFLPAIFLFSIYYMKNGKLLRAYTFLILALMVNEFVPLIVIAIGLYYFLLNRQGIVAGISQRRVTKSLIFSLIIIFTGIFWFILATSVISHFNPTALSTKWEWGEFGQSPTEILINVITNPVKTVYVLLSDGQNKFLYISALFGPFLFLSFLDPLTLVMAAPWLMVSMLSSNPLYYAIGPQYSAFIAAFIFISAINGLKTVGSLTTRGTKKIAIAMAVIIILTFLLFPIERTPVQTKSDETVRQAMSMTPADASISVMPEIFPHFSSRLDAYPYFNEGVDYVLVDINSWWYTTVLPRPTHVLPTWSESIIGDEYGIVVNAHGIILYERGRTEEPEIFVPMNLSFDYKNLESDFGEIVSDATSLSDKVLVHYSNISSGVFWTGSFGWIPPGVYNVTVSLKVVSNDVDSILLFNVVAREPYFIELGEIEIFGNDFVSSNTWQSFNIVFTRSRPALVEIEGYVTNATDVYLDFINVQQVSGGV